MILNVLFGVVPLKTEKSGLFFSLLGALLVYFDPKAKRMDSYEASNRNYGALVMSSVFGLAYLLFNDK